MDDRIKTAFDYARATTIQLITLSTGILALEISFKKDIIENISDCARFWIFSSWFIFLLSILFGMWTMMAITGTMVSKKKLSSNDLYLPNIRIPSLVQIFLFLLGLLATCMFGWLGFSSK